MEWHRVVSWFEHEMFLTGPWDFTDQSHFLFCLCFLVPCPCCQILHFTMIIKLFKPQTKVNPSSLKLAMRKIIHLEMGMGECTNSSVGWHLNQVHV